VRITIVVGAGASLAHAIAVGDGDTTRLPPTDATFFQRIAERKIKVGRELTEAAVDLLGYDPFATPHDEAPAAGMESFFKDLFYDFVSNAADADAQTAYRDLVATYAAVLRRTTNSVAAVGARGPLFRLLRAAARRATRLSLVTFNHDLILENILASSKTFASGWCLRHSYGAFGKDLRYTLSSGTEGFNDPEGCRHGRPILIHKLHGSMNWYFNLEDPDDDREALLGRRLSNQTVQVTLRKQIPQRLRFRGQAVRFVVVPPIYAKQAFLETFMKPVWEEATNDLKRTRRLVFFGYSLPPTDIEAEKLFQRAVKQNSQLRWIDLINPDPGAASRYAEVFPQTPLRRYATLDDFMASKASLDTASKS
jgi:hypothetical protein